MRLRAFFVEAVAAVPSHGLARQIAAVNQLVKICVACVLRDGHQGIRERPLPPVSLPDRDIHDAGLIVQAERLVVLLMHLVSWRGVILSIH